MKGTQIQMNEKIPNQKSFQLVIIMLVTQKKEKKIEQKEEEI